MHGFQTFLRVKEEPPTILCWFFHENCVDSFKFLTELELVVL
jgi:hypothetical protein